MPAIHLSQHSLSYPREGSAPSSPCRATIIANTPPDHLAFALPDGRAAISSGVERELQHAHEAAKEVYVIWPAKQHPSVFITQTANTVFASVNEALDFFKSRYVSAKS